MYNERPNFEAPDNELTTVWRYMNFAKFVSLLDQKALFFARSSMFEDPFEGLYSNANLNEISSIEKLDENSNLLQNMRLLLNISLAKREHIFLSCWHMSEFESAAMWGLYSKDGMSLSIQSNFKRLKACFSQCQYKVSIGVVKYIDWNKDRIPYDNMFWPFSYKRKSFEHEHEIRALIDVFMEVGDEAYQIDKDSKIQKIESFVNNGVYVKVDLVTLIDKIFVSPKSPKWFLNLVKSVSQKYGLDKEVVQSNLYDGPLY